MQIDARFPEFIRLSSSAGATHHEYGMLLKDEDFWLACDGEIVLVFQVCIPSAGSARGGHDAGGRMLYCALYSRHLRGELTCSRTGRHHVVSWG